MLAARLEQPLADVKKAKKDKKGKKGAAGNRDADLIVPDRQYVPDRPVGETLQNI